MATIYLTQDRETVVDEIDYPLLSKWRWTFQPGRPGSSLGYAVRWVRRTSGSRVWKEKIYMHRFITGCKPGFHTDHRDRDGLNNRRSNLRVCTVQQNNANRLVFRGTEYTFRGVTREQGKKFRARFGDRHLGMFARPEDAARRYDIAALREVGVFAWTNFPLDEYVHLPELQEVFKEEEIPW